LPRILAEPSRHDRTQKQRGYLANQVDRRIACCSAVAAGRRRVGRWFESRAQHVLIRTIFSAVESWLAFVPAFIFSAQRCNDLDFNNDCVPPDEQDVADSLTVIPGTTVESFRNANYTFVFDDLPANF
jgi:hypothetical protein